MTRVSLLGAIVVLSAVTATPALAQRMIEEPGAYAFYHPNADLGIGTTRQPADAMAMAAPRTMHRLMSAKPAKSSE